ncbi:uncharacterized protein I303_102787 [Kwoniella dejecticola CBS 10117]|uniref:DUF7702 domain-containing protein n=1 Tax=Kwoniella dejecticola CBS 10117 TaxID=1296121 RepID=A0A1A6A9P7_9TREE|nr:uncharacterized protein I303_02802 [Kwoniella dejecticola CBS 10117]OBR86787.1 hypothetical protein I303_02802 [Kwoniella dejecticola CBS 10117]
MSSASTQPDYTTISNINFTGGFPTSADLAPSIVFLILYALTIPVLLWRWFRKSDRTTILIRPTVFQACRIGMLVIRAYMSKNTYGEGLLIAELVLVSIGFLFLIDPVSELWKNQVASHMPKHERPGWIVRLTWLIKILILVAIATAIAGSVQISSAIDDPSKLDMVKHLRQASVVVSFAAVVVVAIAAALTHFRYPLDHRGTIYILTVAACLIIVSVYRMVQTFSTDPSAPVRSLAAFWVLQMVFEFFAFCLIIGISIPTWFPGEKGRLSRTNSDEEMGRITPAQQVQVQQK